MIVSTSPSLWTISELTDLLTTLGAASRVVTAIPPTTTARLRWLLSRMESSPSVFSATPAWTYSSNNRDRITTLQRADTAIGLTQWADPFVDSLNVDRYVIDQPLSALFNIDQQMQHSVRIRTLDCLFGDLISCEALVVGSGMAAMRLLAGAKDLLDSRKPLIAIDMFDEIWLDGVYLGQGAAMAAELPDYIPVAPNHGSGENGRFLVMVPTDTEIHAIPSTSPTAPYSMSSGGIFVTNGRWLRQTHRIGWNGRAPGLSLFVEQPGEATKVQISLLSPSCNGINVFINDKRLPCLERTHNIDDPYCLEFSIQSEDRRDRLLVVTLAPVRPSTTTRPERLEIADLRFTL